MSPQLADTGRVGSNELLAWVPLACLLIAAGVVLFGVCLIKFGRRGGKRDQTGGNPPK